MPLSERAAVRRLQTGRQSCAKLLILYLAQRPPPSLVQKFVLDVGGNLVHISLFRFNALAKVEPELRAAARRVADEADLKAVDVVVGGWQGCSS